MEESLFRVGVIGWGRIVNIVHAPVLNKINNVIIAAVTEPDVTRDEHIKKQAPRAIIYREIDQMLAERDLSAILIAAPNQLHAAIAIKCLEAGIPIYLEKPIATTLEDGSLLVQVWRACKIPAMIGFNYRFHAGIRQLKKILSSEKIKTIEATFTIDEVTPEWKKQKTSGGILLDLASHHVDLVEWLSNSAFRHFKIKEDKDEIMVVGELENGVSFKGQYASHLRWADKMTFETNTKKIEFDRLGKAWPDDGGWQWPRTQKIKLKLMRKLHPGYEPSFEKSIRYFVDAVRKKISFDAISPSLDDGWKCLQVLLKN